MQSAVAVLTGPTIRRSGKNAPSRSWRETVRVLVRLSFICRMAAEKKRIGEDSTDRMMLKSAMERGAITPQQYQLCVGHLDQCKLPVAKTTQSTAREQYWSAAPGARSSGSSMRGVIGRKRSF